MRSVRAGVALAFATLGSGAFVGACSLFSPLGYLTEGGVATDGAAPNEGSTPTGDGGPNLPPPEIVISGQKEPRHLRADATTLFWSDVQGAVWSVSKNGGSARELAKAPVGASVDFIAIESASDGYVYYAAGPGVYRVPKAGGASTRLFTGTYPAHALVLDGTTLYLASYDRESGSGELWSMATDGTNPKSISLSESPVSLLADTAYVVWPNLGFTYDIRALPKVGGDAGAVAYADVSGDLDFGDFAESFALDAENVYFANDSSFSGNCTIQRLARVPKSTPSVIFSDDKGLCTSLFFDGLDIYFNEESSGSVFRVSKSGGDPQRFVVGQPAPHSVVADESSVFFAGGGSDDGAIFRVAK